MKRLGVEHVSRKLAPSTENGRSIVDDEMRMQPEENSRGGPHTGTRTEAPRHVGIVIRWMDVDTT